jgi:hypothetical protein
LPCSLTRAALNGNNPIIAGTENRKNLPCIFTAALTANELLQGREWEAAGEPRLVLDSTTSAWRQPVPWGPAGSPVCYSSCWNVCGARVDGPLLGVNVNAHTHTHTHTHTLALLTVGWTALRVSPPDHTGGTHIYSSSRPLLKKHTLRKGVEDSRPLRTLPMTGPIRQWHA